jgi:hypothetical protein
MQIISDIEKLLKKINERLNARRLREAWIENYVSEEDTV